MNLLLESSIKIKGLEKEVKKMFAWLHNLFESSGNLKGFLKKVKLIKFDWFYLFFVIIFYWIFTQKMV